MPVFENRLKEAAPARGSQRHSSIRKYLDSPIARKSLAFSGRLVGESIDNQVVIAVRFKAGAESDDSGELGEDSKRCLGGPSQEIP